MNLAPELLAQLPEPLRAVLTQLVGQLQDAHAQIQSLTTENQLLRQKLDALIRRYFSSPKNEHVDPQQLQLLLAGLNLETPVPPAAPAEKPATPAKVPSARKPARSGFPENLPVERVVLLPEEVQAHPDQFRQIEEVVTKELDYEPGRFFWRHFVRPKFVRRSQPTASTASPVAGALALAAMPDPPEVLTHASFAAR